MQTRTRVVGAAFIALAIDCGRTDLLPPGLDAGAGVDAAGDEGNACGCTTGQRCVDGGCVCDSIACPSGCCSAGQCVSGTTNQACGTAGQSCLACCMSQTCTAGACIGATANSGVVLFGKVGTSAPNFLSETWAWDGTSWTQQDVVGPGSRDSASMARLNDTSVMFGGFAYIPTDTFLGDTWIWDGCWTQLAVQGPSAREYATMATLGNDVVLFGGLDANGVQGDTWTWNGAIWTHIDTPGPGPRTGHAMATLNDTVVLFGGSSGDWAIPGSPLLGDTWSWNGTSWTQLVVEGPSPRAGAAMATFDGSDVLFGGMDESGNILGDTWTWDGTTWTQMDVTGPRTALDLTKLPNLVARLDDTVVLFAGYVQDNGPLSATWTWNGNSWTLIQGAQPNLLQTQFLSAVMSAW
jgi:hypothetical protein